MNLKILFSLISILNFIIFTLSDDKTPCKMKKKIVLDVGTSGLGNRFVAIVSTAFMAILMDRELEILWDKNHGCKEKYHHLFRPKPSEYKFKPLITRDKPENEEFHIAKTCKIHIDGKQEDLRDNKEIYSKVSFHHFMLMEDTHLFDKMKDDCDVIFIHANMYFANYLLEDFRKLPHKLRQMFPKPFHDMSKLVLRPQDYILQRVRILTCQMVYKNPTDGSNLKWLSVQARGIFSRGIEGGFKCINKLITTGQIGKVFFATDSRPLQDLAFDMIKDAKQRLVIISKDLEEKIDANIDTFHIRDTTKDIENAVLEWYMIGEAPYCMSFSIDLSSFSKTALVRGNCVLIENYSENCEIPTHPPDKEWLLYQINSNKIKY